MNIKSSRGRPRISSAGETDARAESLLPRLSEAQSCSEYLDSNALRAVSDELGISDARTFGAATFYSMLATQPRSRNVIRVCDGPVCQLFGCEQLRQHLGTAAPAEAYTVERSSCLGLCDRAPAALVNLEACGPLSSDRIAPLFDGWRGSPTSYEQPRTGEVRVALARLGQVVPGEVDSLERAGGYEALRFAIAKEPERVLQAVTESGLQGRGGAGFPTGKKWQLVADAEGPRGNAKYIVCNADESEPASFKDRVLMEQDPHLLLEGMALAGYAVGAETGYIYIRGEYESAALRLEQAITQAEQNNWLGERVLGSPFSFRVHLHRGAGAYICGEETALLESLEGRRGEPRLRPPFPTTHGFRGHPTVVNNVETLCKVPAIVRDGAAWYRSMGTSSSPGTKLFTVTGHVKQPGLFEAPFGITLRQAIDDFCGGMQDGSRFKMALTGGAAGTIVSEQSLDIPLDFAASDKGVSLGSGAILVCDESVPVIRLLGWLLRFFEVESCGKCTPCRDGTREVRQIVELVASSGARQEHVEQLQKLAKMLRLTSLCGLGQSVAWPIDSALVNFPDEFRI